MLFTKCSQNEAQIGRTKGFDPIQRARHPRAFCCQTFPRLSSPLSRVESKLCPPPNTPSDVLERLHHNQLALEAALLELTLLVESQDVPPATPFFRLCAHAVQSLHALFGISGAGSECFRGEAQQKSKKDFSLDEKNGPLFRDPFFNAWSGKRDSHLVSDPLKS